jgi:hypothetical protein
MIIEEAEVGELAYRAGAAAYSSFGLHSDSI